MSRLRGTTAVMVGIGSALVAGAAFAHASPNAPEDGADTFNLASGTAVTGTTAKVVISMPSASPSMIITCTASSFAGKTGTTLKFSIGRPSFNDGSGKPCTDNLGFTDTFESSNLNGAWTLVEKDFTNSGAGDETLAEPNPTGDRLLISIPKAGLIDTNNWPCSITFSPAGASSFSGAYNDAGTFTVRGAKLPVSVSGPAFCGPASQTVTITVSYKASPTFYDRG